MRLSYALPPSFFAAAHSASIPRISASVTLTLAAALS